MDIARFEEISLTLGIGGLILYMFFIMYKLSQESAAGAYGTAVIFLSLGLGIVGFAAKSMIQIFMKV